jgi:hypothetical protein
LKLFKKKETGDPDLPRVCCFCERATLISDEHNVLCCDRGIVSADYFCHNFSYDPLKRAPKTPPVMPKFDPSDPGTDFPMFSFGFEASPESESSADANEPETKTDTDTDNDADADADKKPDEEPGGEASSEKNGDSAEQSEV